MSKCYIFGSMEVNTPPPAIAKNDLIIAADAGLKNLEKFKIMPDYIVGDFDSLQFTPEGKNVIKHPIKKNETDTLLAVDTAFQKGYKFFEIYGCLGGRLDQTVASIQTAAYIVKKGGNAVFIDGSTHLTVLENNSISFTKKSQGTISVFAYSGPAKGVKLKNLLYELNNAELTPLFPLGVSNEFTGKESEISVENGMLCVIWDSDNAEYKIK